MKGKKIYFFIIFLFFSLSCNLVKDWNSPNKPNILFIAVDDLRPELGVYGNNVVKSPNIDQLAKEGSYFTRHYVQVPTCGASRFSLMTGLRPKKSIHINNQVFYKEMANKSEKPKPESFVHQLKRNGYTTVGIGKLSHSVDGLVYEYEDEPSDIKEMPHSWDRFIFNPEKWKTGWNAFFGYANGENRQSLKKQVRPYEAADVSDIGYPDGLILQSAINELKELKLQKKPFFLGVGFFKPHLPFNAPKKYWDLYKRDQIPIASDPYIPEGINKKSLGSMGEFYSYKLSDEIPNLENSISEAYAKKLVHGYYASISYVDSLVGKLIEELRILQLEKNTIIFLWGDHGWHLGNDRKWGKHTLFERSLKSVLIIKVPGIKTVQKKINTIVETVDLYPTLMELCGLKNPYELDGESLLSLIQNKNFTKNQKAFSFWEEGVSMRTDRYRLTQFYRNESPKIELYDHRNDPEENINIAAKKMKLVDSLLPFIAKIKPNFYN